MGAQNKNVARAIAATFGAYCFVAGAAIPTDLLRAGYAVYSADINSDGCTDYLVKAKDALVLIDLDDGLTVPFPVPSVNKPFILLSGAGCSYTLQQSLTKDQIKTPPWATSSYSVIVADSQGNGYGSLILSPLGSMGTLFNVGRNANLINYTLLQSLSSSDFQLNLPGVTTGISYSGTDSRTDISVFQNGSLIGFYVADVDGKYAANGTENNIAAATATWNSFMQFLFANNKDGALGLISEDRREEIRVVMTSPTADLIGYAQSVVGFDAISDTDGIVRALVRRKDASADVFGFYVTLSKTADGVWRIISL